MSFIEAFLNINQQGAEGGFPEEKKAVTPDLLTVQKSLLPLPWNYKSMKHFCLERSIVKYSKNYFHSI